jgi:hypothetical protein
MVPSMPRRLFAAVCTLLVLTSGGGLEAQPRLRITHLTVAMPRIELRVEASCDDVPIIGLGTLDMRLTENGVDVPNFTVLCPNDTQRCALNVALVIDGSGSMMGQPMDDTKQAAKTFIGELDGVRDSASVTGFNSSVYLLQGRTADRALLQAAVDRITPAGLTSLWDASFAGLGTLEGSGGCRALIVLTDGIDNTSTRTSGQVIARAKAMGIPIFMIGLGISVDDAALEQISYATGGQAFFTASSSDLARIFQRIARIIKFPDPACTIVYSGECLNTETRTLTVTVQGPCAPLTADTTFATPGTIGVTTPVRIVPLAATRAAGLPVRVPVVLPDATSDLYVGQADAELRYDPALLAFLQVDVAAGSLLSPGAVAVLDDRPGRLRLRLVHGGTLRGSGGLVDIVFRTAPVMDSVCTPVTLARVSFDGGCIVPLLDSADVCIVPCPPPPTIVARGPVVLCPGASVTLAVPAGYESYVWYRDGGVQADTTDTLRVDLPGIYHVVVETATGCVLSAAPFEVQADRAVSYVFGRTGAQHVQWGEDLVFEMGVDPPLLAGRAVDLTLLVHDSSGLLSYAGHDVGPSGLAAWASFTTMTDGSGAARLHVRGTPSADAASLGRLRFTVRPRDEIMRVMLHVEVESVTTACLLEARGVRVPVVLDGYCARVVARSASRATLTVHPHPVSARAVLTLMVASPVEVRFALHDASGSVVASSLLTHLERSYAAGRHVLAFATDALPTGTYRLVAQFGDGTSCAVPLVVVH